MTSVDNSRQSILIVDDEESLRNTFRIFLRREGYGSVVAVGTFDDAVEEVRRRPFDLIVCDIVLESRSGIDLLKRIRDMGAICPVVIITGYPQVETASEAVRLGAFDYLAKPVDKEALLKTARMAVQQYRLEQEKREVERSREGYRRFLETILRSVGDAIFTVDRDTNFLQVNEAARRLFAALHRAHDGWQSGNIDDFCRDSGLDTLPAMVREVLENEAGGAPHSGESGGKLDLRLECRIEGRRKTYSACVTPLEDCIGGMEGCVVVIRDISCAPVCTNEARSGFHRLIGASPVMQQVYMMIENIGRVDTSVLVTGPSGTGKELVVHALHQESARRNRPLVMVDCTAIPDNLMESELFGHRKGAFTGADAHRSGRIIQAEGGTLFLDEIGDISMTMQLRLLRFLQERSFYPVGRDRPVHVDVRVVAATNADLRGKVREGSFREDLYYRLMTIEIELPPLRARHGDIAQLAQYFVCHYAGRLGKNINGVSQQALERLEAYDWPGNVRQFEHIMERACVLCEDATISCRHLPAEICAGTHSIKGGGESIGECVGPKPIDLRQPTAAMAPSHASSPAIGFSGLTMEIDQQLPLEQRIIAALQMSGGNKAKAARCLKMDRSTLYRKMRELRIDRNMFSF